MLFSVIIPVYNTPIDLFERCIKSILDQIYDCYELLVINDGSKTELSKKYQEICEKHEKIQYFVTENQGVSAARNRGMINARGDYLCFVDADDIVDKAFLLQASRYIDEYHADLIIGRIVYIPSENNGQNISKVSFETNQNNVFDAMFSIEKTSGELKVLGSPCGRIYNSLIAKRILFDNEVKYWEDQLFNREFVNVAKSVLFVPEDWYYYFQNDFSAMHSNHKKWRDLDEWRVFLYKWMEPLSDSQYDEAAKKIFAKHLLTYFFVYVKEGILAGEVYSRKSIKNIIKLDPFQFMCSYLKDKDFVSLKRRMQLFIIKHYYTFCIYYIAKIQVKKIKSK